MLLLQKKHFWVFAMMEAAPDNGMDYDVAEAMPEATPEAQRKAVAYVKAWLKSLPLSRRPLCKASFTSVPCPCTNSEDGWYFNTRVHADRHLKPVQKQAGSIFQASVPFLSFYTPAPSLARKRISGAIQCLECPSISCL